MKEIEIEVRLRMLEINTAKLDLALRAIFSNMQETQRSGALETLKYLGIAEFAQSARDELAAEQLKGTQAFIESLRALHNAGDKAALAVAMQAMLFLQTPGGQQEALQSWIGTASETELEDDLAEALRKLMPQPPGPHEAPDASDGRGKETPRPGASDE